MYIYKETPLWTQIIELDNWSETILSRRRTKLTLIVQYIANTPHFTVYFKYDQKIDLICSMFFVSYGEQCAKKWSIISQISNSKKNKTHINIQLISKL